jgi:hypothetical protein
MKREKTILRVFRAWTFSHSLDPKQMQQVQEVEHDPEKCAAVFRKDHAQTKT